MSPSKRRAATAHVMSTFWVPKREAVYWGRPGPVNDAAMRRVVLLTTCCRSGCGGWLGSAP